MSTIDPTPEITSIAALPGDTSSGVESQSNRTLSLPSISFPQEAKRQIEDTLVATLRPLLIIVRITFIFIVAILADALIIAIINWSFGNMINHYPFAALILEGIQLLSALGTAAAYIIYLVPSLIKDAKKAIREFQSESSEEGK